MTKQWAMIKKRADFLHVKRGVCHKARSFILEANWQPVENDNHPKNAADLPPFRYGITVSNRTAKPLEQKSNKKQANQHRRGPVSVNRNKMRRRLKHALLKVAPPLSLEKVDYVIIGRRNLLNTDFKKLVRDLELAFKKVNELIINQKSQKAPSKTNE